MERSDFLIYALFVVGCVCIAIPTYDYIQMIRLKRFLLLALYAPYNSPRSMQKRRLRDRDWYQKRVARIASLEADARRLFEIDQSRTYLLSCVISSLAIGFIMTMILSHSILISIIVGILSSFSGFGIYRQIRFQIYADLVSKYFPNAVDGLVRCLKAGFDLNRSLTIVSMELPKVLQSEFNLMIRNRNLGQPLGDAMYFMASRLRNREALFLATLIAVQERTGGPLVEALESLSQILRDRDKLRQKRRVASAEARMSALILAGLPLAIALLLFATNPSYRDILLNTTSGRGALIFGFALLLTGSFVMYRMIRMPST